MVMIILDYFFFYYILGNIKKSLFKRIFWVEILLISKIYLGVKVKMFVENKFNCSFVVMRIWEDILCSFFFNLISIIYLCY